MSYKPSTETVKAIIIFIIGISYILITLFIKLRT